MKVVASWSGGKDSCYAYYLATHQGHQVMTLVTMMMNESKSNFHMIPSGILDAQAKAMGIPLIKKIFKCNKRRAEQTFDWFNLQFGLRIKN
mgnify:CR=1 FL=1